MQNEFIKIAGVYIMATPPSLELFFEVLPLFYSYFPFLFPLPFLSFFLSPTPPSKFFPALKFLSKNIYPRKNVCIQFFYV